MYLPKKLITGQLFLPCGIHKPIVSPFLEPACAVGILNPVVKNIEGIEIPFAYGKADGFLVYGYFKGAEKGVGIFGNFQSGQGTGRNKGKSPAGKNFLNGGSFFIEKAQWANIFWQRQRRKSRCAQQQRRFLYCNPQGFADCLPFPCLP